MGATGHCLKLSGLIYGYGPSLGTQLKKAQGVLDRVDILVPLSDLRPPLGREEKSRQMLAALQMAGDTLGPAGIGFPHATQVESNFLLDMCAQAVQAGAGRLTLYDTNGGSDPFKVADLVAQVREIVKNVELCFHAHNDLGMATANSLAAVMSGADCLDLTVNGLGDRAGNASLEQVALALYLRGMDTGLKLDLLSGLSKTVEAMTLIPISKLAPVIGEFVFCHKSPSHLDAPTLFEAFDPALVGSMRSLCKR
jgi:isopropylmalate/homocitrate/citramalate synthase